ncbi:hypothetical protein ACPUYX_03650 [Desulfosporosinus sp. SYSU MS00001]|uniref:hypothetical protein n=1 Tax=Desulfosporosinus sp. SYSU MS00001 TaxID=3416284 RepID=UPI003CEFF8C9
MIKDKAKFLVLVGILLIIGSCGFSIYTNSKAYIANKELTHDELTKCISQYWFQDEQINFTIELEKDIDDLHLLLLSYQQDPNSSQKTGLAVFKRLPNGKYRYTFFAHPTLSTISTVVLTPNEGVSSKSNYGVIFGIISNNQPSKYSVTFGGNEYTDTFEKNKYFIREYDLKTQTGFSWRSIYN